MSKIARRLATATAAGTLLLVAGCTSQDEIAELRAENVRLQQLADTAAQKAEMAARDAAEAAEAAKVSAAAAEISAEKSDRILQQSLRK